MPMQRAEKEAYIETLREQCARADAVILGVNRGLSVDEMTALRREMRGKSLLVKVAKNTLLRRAAKGTAVEVLADHFTGSTVLILAETEAVAPSKALKEFMKSNQNFTVKAAMLEGREITVKEWEALADLPSREELLAGLMGAMTAPVSKLAGLMNRVTGNFLGTLDAYREKLEKEAA
jgi:large subunit ribosomal protein L10